MSSSQSQDIKDFWCDSANPRSVPFELVTSAAYRIRDGIVKTPCDVKMRLKSSTSCSHFLFFPLKSSHMSKETGMDIYLKKDYMQYTGSFKERGARFTLLMLTDAQKEKGVIAASAGNHAQALAYHGGLLGVPVTVVMPVVAPIMKVENCKKYGATVVSFGQNVGESREKALELAKEKDLMYING